MSDDWLSAGVAALFGLLIGSFLNVCIYRWPRDLSVISPRSHCPGCDRTIAWYDNIPVFSYLLLGARCRHCAMKIHWRYPLVELLTAAAFAWFAWQMGLTLPAARYCLFASLVIGLVFSDLDMLILPDEFTVGGLIAGLAFSLVVAVPDSTFGSLAALAGFAPGFRMSSLGEAVSGAIIPAGTLWLAGWIFEKVRHKQGLGFGDVKMIAMIGAFLGIRGALLTLIAGSIAGSVVGGLFILGTRKDAGSYQLPFAAFLGAGALFAAMGGQEWFWRALS